MARVMMSLGGFTFELETLAHQKLVLSQSWRWAEQARITRDAALQYVGRNPGEIDLDGVIYPTFKGDLADIEQLRQMADEGQPQMLVDGMGRVLGKWVIVEIGDTRSVFIDDGRARKVEFRIKLKYYGEDR